MLGFRGARQHALSWDVPSFLPFLGPFRLPATRSRPQTGNSCLTGSRNRLNCFYRGPTPGLPQTGHEKPVLGCCLSPERCALEIVDFYSTWINLVL